MVDPFDVTHYNRTQKELEEFLLFGLFVAGKKATVIAQKLDDFLKDNPQNLNPLDLIKSWIKDGSLRSRLKAVKLGKYDHFEKALNQLCEKDLDLKACTVDDLKSIHSIGDKTSRYFILHTRKNVQVACIDTHIKKYLRKNGITSNKYEDLEKAFIEIAKKKKKSIADLDLEIWTEYTNKKPENVS